MMEISVKTMLMVVTSYHVLKVNNVLTTLLHWLEQNVLVPVDMLLEMTPNVLVSVIKC